MRLLRLAAFGIICVLTMQAQERRARPGSEDPASIAGFAHQVRERGSARSGAARERVHSAERGAPVSARSGGTVYEYTTAGAKLGGRGPVPVATAARGGYLGGNDSDRVTAMAKDADGNLIVVGSTLSTDFQASSGAIAQKQGDVFVQKLKGDGSAAVWTAILGGNATETANAVAVDAAGAIYVAGRTQSTNLPVTTGAYQAVNRGGLDGFVAKLSKDGSTLLYLTYLGGSGNDYIYGMAVDANGVVAVTGYTDSSDFATVTGSSRSAFGAGPGALVTRLDAAGKSLLSSTVLTSTSGYTEGGAAAFRADGALVIAGTTSAPDLLVGTGFQKYSRSAGLWRSTAESPGVAASEGMRGTSVNWVAVDPLHPQVLYAATQRGVFKSTDGALNWTASNTGLNSATILHIAIDPVSTNIVYAATAGGLFRSVDSGASWNAVGSGPGKSPAFVAIDAQSPSTLYVATDSQGVMKSSDSGSTWKLVNNGFTYPLVMSLAVDWRTPNTVLAASYEGVFRSVDGGQMWSRSLSVPGDLAIAVAVDPKDPSLIYASFLFDVCYRSSDGGVSWQRMTSGLPASVYVWAFAPHPKVHGAVYAATSSGVYFSRNDGRNWSLLNGKQAGLQQFSVAPDPQDGTRLYSGGRLWEEAFLLRFAKDGQTLQYSTYFGGETFDSASAVAVDSNGDCYVTGVSDAADFPTTPGAAQSTPAGYEDAFLLRIDGKSGALTYSTLLGGDGSDLPTALSLGPDGLPVIAGLTTSSNFPITAGATGSPLGGVSDAFVAKLSTAGPAFVLSTLYGGSKSDGLYSVLSTADGIWLGGATSSPDLPTGLAGLSKTYLGGQDGFLAHLAPLATEVALEPASLSFSITADTSATPQSQTITVASRAGALRWSFVVNADSPWLRVSQDDADPTKIVVTVDASALAVGTYQGGFSAAAETAGVAAITVQVTLKVKSNASPVLAEASVLNGADLQPGPVSPGLVVQLRGDGFGPEARVHAVPVEGVLPTQVAGVRVFFGDVAAPIEWVENGAIGAIVPYAVGGAEQVTVVVERQGMQSAPVTLAVQPTAPALFTADGSGSGPLEATNEDYTVNGSANPAVRGRPVILHGTGEGLTDPPSRDGLLALEFLPAAVAQIEVLIGGLPCDLYYAGAAPVRPAGYVELNLKVPEEAPAGDAVPVTLRIGGRESRALTTIALK